ncbi:MAG: KH domain-containing protein [Candidatus Altiarchaeota archaeon]
MALPICSICAKSGVLCSACEAKLQNGTISALDVELSRILYKIGEDIEFERAIETENFVIILTKTEYVGKTIGKGGENIKILSKKLKKPVRVIGSENLEKMIYDFVFPAKILGISLIYKADGSKKYKVRIAKNDKKKLRMSVSEIHNIIASITKTDVEIVFE